MVKRPKQLKRSVIQLSRRQWVLIGGVGVVIIAAGLVLFSYLSWQRHERTMQEHQSAAQTATSNLMRQEAATLEQLTSYSVYFAHHMNQMCQQSALEQAYRQVVDAARQSHERCETMRQQYLEHERKIDAAMKYLYADEELAKILRTVRDDLAKLDGRQYQQRLERWQRAGEEEIKQLSVIDSYQSVLDEVATAIDDIVAAYRAVIEADKSQKRPAHDDAIVDLNNAYARLRDSRVLADKEAQRVTEALLRSAQAVLVAA